MAIDIRQGNTPFTRISKPNEKQKQSHIKRYFAKNLYSIIRLFSLVIVFLMPMWIFGFNADTVLIKDFWLDRNILWILASSIIFILFFLYSVIFVEKFLYIRFALNAGLFLIFICAVISTFFGFDLIRSIGLRSFDSSVNMLFIIFGVLWMFFLINFPYNKVLSFKKSESDREFSSEEIDVDIGFPKIMLVAHLLGSTLLIFYIIFFYFLSDEKSHLSWIYNNSWLVVFAVNVFLLTGFAMLQKGIVKIIWSFAIILHIFVLFLWDSTPVWIITILGISILLIFQIIYSKNLWQKNFTYPLQIWALSFVLLLVPVKMFTGTTYKTQEFFVPQKNILNFDISSKQRFFGTGPSNSFIRVLKEKIEPLDPRKDDSFIFNSQFPIATYRLISIEYGLFGIFAFVVFILLFLSSGINFLKNNIQTYKKNSFSSDGASGMSETSYLGSIVFCAFIMICASILFTAWSFIIWWMLIFLAGISICLQSFESEKIFKKIDCSKAGNFYVFKVSLLIVFSIACVFYSYFYIQSSRSQNFAYLALRAEDQTQSFGLWQSATETNPRNNMFLAKLVQAELNFLNQDTPLNDQRDILERSTQRLSYIVNSSTDPFVLWLAADTYISLEKYAQGSINLARKTYLNILDQMPYYLYVPVALSKFYQEYGNNLVSAETPASSLILEARNYLEKDLKTEPSYLPAILELSFIIEEEDGTDEAIKQLEPWEDKSPEIMYHVGRLYFNDGDFSKASEKFSQVVHDVPNHSNARYSLGIAYFRLSQYDDSLYQFEELLRLNPDNKDIQEKIKQVKEKIGG